MFKYCVKEKIDLEMLATMMARLGLKYVCYYEQEYPNRAKFDDVCAISVGRFIIEVDLSPLEWQKEYGMDVEGQVFNFLTALEQKTKEGYNGQYGRFDYGERYVCV